MDWIGVLLTVMSVVMVPSVAWLVKSIIALQRDFAQLKSEVGANARRCDDRFSVVTELGTLLRKIDRNVVRLGVKSGVDLEE